MCLEPIVTEDPYLSKGLFVTIHISLESKMEEKQALQYLIKILAKRSYLSGECERKLKQKGFSPESIAKAIALCQEKGYLDDPLYHKKWIDREKEKGRSYLACKHKWGMKTAGDFTQFVTVEKRGFEQEALKKYLAKKQLVPCNMSREEKGKWIQKLLRQGFSWEQVETVFQETAFQE